MAHKDSSDWHNDNKDINKPAIRAYLNQRVEYLKIKSHLKILRDFQKKNKGAQQKDKCKLMFLIDFFRPLMQTSEQ